MNDDTHTSLTNKEVEAKLEHGVYHACKIIEQMEHEGRIYGNGHHAMQKIALIARNELKSRWLPNKEIDV